MSAAIRWSLGPHEAAVRARLEAFTRDDLAGRLARRDPTIWGGDPAHVKVASNRMGWIGSPAVMRGRAAEFGAFAAEVAAEGFTHVVLLGMGGSSLAPEVLRHAFGVAPGALELTVLDNTAPSAVAAVLAAHDARRTLFLVSSKSGGTLEVTSFEKRCWAWVQAARGDAGRAFVAITDPGTSLEALARSRGYRRTFTNPADIGGRYSALSCFGLVPAALLGIDVGRLLDGAVAEMDAALLERDAARNPGLALGAALGELARAGRDKVTLVLEGAPAPLGSWIEQLVAESTGKSGHGLLPVADERLANPLAYGPDRVFVAVSDAAPSAATTARLEALEHAGHPVIRWQREGALALGAEFVRWELATVAAAVAIGVDPFDEPNVAEAKSATGEALERALAGGEASASDALVRAGGRSALAPAAVADALRVHVGDASDPLAWAAALPQLAGRGDYVAILAYLHATPARLGALERLRHAVRDRTRAAVTLGWGPRYLHSTGQLHKGGPATGVFLQIVADEPQEPIPGERYGFRELQRAQADGDYRVLDRHGLRVLRLDAGATPDDTLARLATAVEAAGAATRTGA